MADNIDDLKKAQIKQKGILGAINQEDVDGLKFLLEEYVYGFDDLAKALRIAAEKGCESCARILLEHKAMPDIHDTNGYSALIIACRQGYANIVKLLIEYNCNINKATLRVHATGVHWASSLGHIDCMELLLDAGCFVDTKTIHGRTPLILASRSGYEDCVEELIHKKANVNSKDVLGNTALHCACEEGNTDCARLLIRAGADINAKANNDFTPLLYAARYGRSQTAKLLLRHSTINLQACAQQMTALHWAAESGDVETIKLFLDHYLPVDIETKNGNYGHDFIVNKGVTPLMVACRNGHCNAVKYLLEKGADVDKYDAEGYAPLTHAIHKDHPECVLLLIRSGSSINVSTPTDDFHCPLFIAIKKSVECLKILLRANVNLNMVGPDSRGILLSPLELALSVSNRSVVCRMLLTAGYKPKFIANPNYLQECLAQVAQDDEALFNLISESINACCSLMQICRDKVRSILGINALSYVNELPLPKSLQTFVEMKELDYI